MKGLRNRGNQVAASSIKLLLLEMGLPPVRIRGARPPPIQYRQRKKKRAADKAAREHFMPNAAGELGIQ